MEQVYMCDCGSYKLEKAPTIIKETPAGLSTIEALFCDDCNATYLVTKTKLHYFEDELVNLRKWDGSTCNVRT